MRLKISRGRLKLRDVINAERGFADTMQMAKFLARFVVGEDGEYLPEDEALERVLDVDVAQLPEITAQLSAEIRKMQGEAVPFPSGAP